MAPLPAAPRAAARLQSAVRRGWLWAWLAAAGVAAAVVRAHGAAGELRALPAHLGGLRLAWLSVAVAAQIVSLAGGTASQRLLLAAGGTRVRWRSVAGPVLASTGLARVVPAGPVTGAAWQVREYRRLGAGAGAGTWAVLAGGFTTVVVTLALLLAGAAIAGTGTLLMLACGGAVLAAIAAGLAAAPRRIVAVSRLSRHPRRAAGLLVYTAVGVAADAGVLAACFGLAGLAVPWRGLLFAYAAGQLGGRIVPLPGGLGGVEGGVIGALAVTGTAPAAAAAAVIIYRVGAFWALGAAGLTVAAALTRRRRSSPELDPDAGRSR
ncbi:MAG: flippase-like domain-containing protein [Actinobacteria bacterium]|nr:flippase-like domain-containing protein [Actinomycetota bacterium]